MRPTFDIEVVTPQGSQYSGKACHALIPVDQGSIGVLAHHAPLVTISNGGRLELRDEKEKNQAFEVGEGFFEVAHNKATFLTQSFQAVPVPKVPGSK